MKPGYTTTEFWLSLLANMIAAAVATGLIGSGTELMRVAAFATMVLATLGYTASRATVKNASGTALPGQMREIDTTSAPPKIEPAWAKDVPLPESAIAKTVVPLLALVMLGSLVFGSGCHASTRDTTIRTALVTANAAEAGFVVWDRAHQHELVQSATSREDGEQKLAAYEAKSAEVYKAVVALYQLLATAALLNDSQSIATAVTAATQLRQLIAELRSKP